MGAIAKIQLKEKLNTIVSASNFLQNKFIAIAVNSIAKTLEEFKFDGSEFSVVYSNIHPSKTGIYEIRNQLAFLGTTILYESIIEFRDMPKKRIYLIVVDNYSGVANQLCYFKFFQKISVGMKFFNQGVFIFFE